MYQIVKISWGGGTKNLFFTGDNLEVLRHLQGNMQNKVDVIYIDPPYNTGKVDDFVYPDKFEYSDDQLQKMFGLSDIEIEKLNNIRKSSSHSAWLTFMYPRLILARKLLTDNGVIFVSIDDNEDANLKIQLDEIFGEQNFIANMVIDGTPKNDPLLIATSHEYVLTYVKNNEIAKKNEWGSVHPLNKTINDLVKGKTPEKAQKELDSYYTINNLKKDNISNYKYVDKKGVFRTGPLDDPQGRGPKDNRINPKTGDPLKIPNGGWRCNLDTWNKWVDNDLIYFPNEKNKLASKKTYLSNDKLEVGRSVLKMQTRKSTNYLKKIFGGKVFNNPKPIELIMDLLKLCGKNITVLDFFAGSGTTADAVMRLNKKDNGNRKFILVQLHESTFDKSKGENIPRNKNTKSALNLGYKYIDEVCMARINKSYYELNNFNSDNIFNRFTVIDDVSTSILDNMKSFREQIINKNAKQTTMFNDTLNDFSAKSLGVQGDATGQDTILTTWLVRDGYSFDINKEKIKFGNYEATIVDNSRLYLIDEGWDNESTKILLNKLGNRKLNIQTIVLFGYSFNIAELKELEIALKELDNKVNLVKRY